MKYQVEFHESFPPGSSLYFFEMQHPPVFQVGEWIVNTELEPNLAFAFLIKGVMWMPHRDSQSQLDSLKVCLLVERRKMPQSSGLAEHASIATAAVE
jgi:hypothetical protein